MNKLERDVEQHIISWVRKNSQVEPDDKTAIEFELYSNISDHPKVKASLKKCANKILKENTSLRNTRKCVDWKLIDRYAKDLVE